MNDWPGLPDAYGYSTAELHALPDDRRRYELIDGCIIVSPSATIDHNTVALWIANALEETCPNPHLVIGTGQSTTIDDRNEVRADVIVTSSENGNHTPFSIKGSQLVVEVVSPSRPRSSRPTRRGRCASTFRH